VLSSHSSGSRSSLHKIAVLSCAISCSGCAGKLAVQGGFDSGQTIYRESAQEDFGSRTTVKVRGFQF
jgi:hypothetical protein